jgi:hypothetical protein
MRNGWWHQALRNFKEVKEFMRIVYATPAYIETLNNRRRSPTTFLSISSCGARLMHQLVEVISAFLRDRKPNTPPHVCVECNCAAPFA